MLAFERLERFAHGWRSEKGDRHPAAMVSSRQPRSPGPGASPLFPDPVRTAKENRCRVIPSPVATLSTVGPRLRPLKSIPTRVATQKPRDSTPPQAPGHHQARGMLGHASNRGRTRQHQGFPPEVHRVLCALLTREISGQERTRGASQPPRRLTVHRERVSLPQRQESQRGEGHRLSRRVVPGFDEEFRPGTILKPMGEGAESTRCLDDLRFVHPDHKPEIRLGRCWCGPAAESPQTACYQSFTHSGPFPGSLGRTSFLNFFFNACEKPGSGSEFRRFLGVGHRHLGIGEESRTRRRGRASVGYSGG